MKHLMRMLRPMRNWLIRTSQRPRIGALDFGDLGRPTPVSRDWGFDRGTPVDRFYIERFLARHAVDIHGQVVEMKDNAYTVKFGGPCVDKSDVLHPLSGNPRATMVADLGSGKGVPAEAFDCVICTHVINLIFPVQEAIASLYRMLKPSGVLLLTAPGISQISREDMALFGDYWRFTTASMECLLAQHFDDFVDVDAVGNVYAATALLHGVAADELDAEALEYKDPQYQMLVTARAVKEG